MNTRFRFVAALAAISFTAISIPAIAHAADPDVSAPTAKQAAPAKAKLNSAARNVILCVPESTAPDAKKVCKTRGAWIKQGRDPLGAN